MSYSAAKSRTKLKYQYLRMNQGKETIRTLLSLMALPNSIGMLIPLLTVEDPLLLLNPNSTPHLLFKRQETQLPSRILLSWERERDKDLLRVRILI